MKTNLLLALGLLLAMGCSDPMKTTYNASTFEADFAGIKSKISKEDGDLLEGYISLAAFADGEGELSGKTYRQILDDAKKWREEMTKQAEEEKALAAKAKLEAEERARRLGSALTVALYDKGFLERDFMEYLVYKFSFENKSDKDIKAFTGEVTISDLFDKPIKSIALTYDDGIPAGETVQWTGNTDYNAFIDTDVALKGKDMDDLKVSWKPEKIIFADGSELQ